MGEVMNRERRQVLGDAAGFLNRSLSLIEKARDQEADVMDNCPENLQGGDRYLKMEEAVDALDDAISALEGAKENLETAMA